MITLNAIAKRLEEFGTNHFFIKSYSFGSPDDVDLDKFQEFPLMHVVYTGSDYDERTKTFSFEVYVFDRPNREEQMTINQREVVSDAQMCLEDVIADIANGGNIFLFDEDYEVITAGITPLIDERSNLLTGALLDLTIQVPYQRDACNLPINGVSPEGGEFAYQRRGILRVRTQNGAVDVLSVNEIRVTNGTLTDEGDGVVSLSITGGAGGAVDSVNGETGDVVLDSDDIDEGTTNLYYTDARVDARVAALDLATETYVDTQVGNEETARITADSGLQTQITTNAGNIATNAGDIDQLETDLAAETAARIAADSALQTDIDTNATAITNEASARASADSNLQSQISSNDGDISALDGRLTTAESDIAALEAITHVNSLNGITGAVTLSAGSNVTLTQVGSDIEISSSGGGGGGGSDSFNTIVVSGQSPIVADHGNDTLTIVAGTGIELTTDAPNDTLTIATDLTTTDVTEGTNLYFTDARVAANSAVVANTAKNSYPTADAAKLAGIEAGAEVNVNADWNAISGDAQIFNKPTLAAVATSGAYADLSGTPSIPTDLIDLGDTPATYGSAGQVLATNATTNGTEWITISGGGGAVDSVNGQTGVVVLDTDDISEGTTNLYYTDTRVQTYLTAEKIAAAYPTTTISGATLTLSGTHEQKMLICDRPTAITITIPTGLSRDAEVLIYQANTGAVTITAGSGVTLRNTSGFNDITAEQYAIVGLKQLGTTDVWIITGERKAV
jgi:hypothetical protein